MERPALPLLLGGLLCVTAARAAGSDATPSDTSASPTPDVCQLQRCFRKCCPLGYVADILGECYLLSQISTADDLDTRVTSVTQETLSSGRAFSEDFNTLRAATDHELQKPSASTAVNVSMEQGLARNLLSQQLDKSVTTSYLDHENSSTTAPNVSWNTTSSEDLGEPVTISYPDSTSNRILEGDGSPSGDLDKLRSLLELKVGPVAQDLAIAFGMSCPCGSYLVEVLSESFAMDEEGSLAFPDYNVSASEYCFDETARGGLVGFVCFAPCPDAEEKAVLVYAVGSLLSLPFLAATFAVYAVCGELRNRVGAALMCYVAALFVAYTLLSVVQMSMGYISHQFCTAVAFIIYFSFLASFFWLNVMCFDIFWTFSGFRSLRGTAREREHKKFIIYSIYSWGCPLIMLCVTLVMQFHDNIPEGYLRPQFGVKKCWFTEDKLTTLAYFYGPVGVLVLCNIILFILTACKIAKLKRETAMLKGTDSRRHDDDNRQRFNLYLKLFLVMGVNWSMEVISWLVGGPEYVWYVTDICNTLQGVLIFVIFVWKDRIRRMLMEKFCPKRASTKLSKSTAVTYSTRASPSRLSHGMLNNKIVDNGNGEAVKIVAISPISDDSDVP